MRKTKIVCTVGPATDSIDVLRDLMKSGMNVARFNFSHGDYETQKRRFDMVCRLRNELGLPIATMLDTKGPEVRLGKFENDEPVKIQDGDTYTLTTRDILCNTKEGCVSFKRLPHDISAGNRILINDGVVELLAEKVTETDIICRIIHGGVLSNNKGINVPGVKLSMPFLSDADMNDLEFGAKQGFDFIAASFVRTAADINYLRKFTQSLGWFDVRIIAKIENLEGVENIDEILEAADGIMVARGDMGAEIPFQQIPSIQKDLIHKGYNAGKQVITATQMLESMINNPRPTRAEITDVANAIYDGTSAIMLSGETAAGSFPVESVKTMALIARTTENDIDYKKRFSRRESDVFCNIATAISHATVTTAHDLNAKAIVTVTKQGQTARLISKYRPTCPIISCTPSERICRQMNLSWGVLPLMIQEETNSDELLLHAVESAKKAGYIHTGDMVVITAGLPLGISGTTNLMKVDKVD
ncbi:pyruvate kinase [Ruminococcus champanellensis]|uniref:pyruvate kinase n=1 Tax=Ruminococcus champanellensis TaxID=1161942 RepID=UPI003AB60FEC